MALVIKLLEALKTAAAFTVERPKDAVIIILLALLALFGWRLNHQKSRTQELAAKLEGLPAGTKQVITIYKDHIVTRWKEGPSKIEYRDRYLPPEGHVDIVTKQNAPDKPPEITVKDWGFTSRFGGGIVYSRMALPELDWKWFYWRRYSLTTGITPKFGGIGISRHVEDFMPFHNLEILGLGGLGWRGDFCFGLGLRTNF